jgi:YegS/Rv2252/BmrU family lipid kinase
MPARSWNLDIDSTLGDLHHKHVRSCLIFNPMARGGKARKLKCFLDTLSTDCTLKPTSCPGDGQKQAMQAVVEGFDTIIACGGDGTVNEVINGIANAPGGFEKSRLGVMPMGTVNVFARELGIPADFPGAWSVIKAGVEMRVDLPLAEFRIDAQPVRRYFIQLGGAGLDSMAIERVSWKLKQKIGKFAYVVAGVQAMMAKHPVITVAEARGVAGELVLLGNGRLYGGSYPLFPSASLSDGLLDVCVYPRISWMQLLKVGLGICSGRIHRFSSTHQVQLPIVTLTSRERMMLELDGENVGELPAKITVQPKALRVVVPA